MKLKTYLTTVITAGGTLSVERMLSGDEAIAAIVVIATLALVALPWIAREWLKGNQGG